MARPGDSRLKLYLWLWWHDQHIKDPELLGVRWTAAAWAQLLALDEHETNGARAVRGQLKWLEQNRYLVRDGRKPPHIQALNVDGRAFPLDTDRSELYIGLPDSFWTGGWITRLSPRAVASLFMVMDYAKPRIRISDAISPRPAPTVTAPAV
jgi:hypothetical protein